MTWSRETTCAPASIKAATDFPSRAPSVTKSLMRAIASGWLSLTPRASLCRAIIAASATSNLSFSRGLKFIRYPPRSCRGASALPEPRQPSWRSQDSQCLGQPAAQALTIGRRNPHGQQPVPAAGGAARRLPEDGANAVAHRHRVGTDPKHRRDRDRAARHGRLAQDRCDRTLQRQRIGIDEPTIAPDPPCIAQPSLDHAFAHGCAAEDDRLDTQKLRVQREKDGDIALERGRVEEDRLLRQPFAARARADIERRRNARGLARAAIDFLRGLPSDGTLSAGAPGDRDRERIAARQAAGRVHEDSVAVHPPRETRAQA